MAKIKFAGNFTGTCTFQAYDCAGKKDTPLIRTVCTDAESGDVAYGDMWCSEKAIPYTVKALLAMGVTGETDSDVLNNAEAELVNLPCTFETELDAQDYIHASNIRGIDQVGGGIEAKGKDAFMAAITGGKVAQPTPARTTEDLVENGEEPPY